jgi:hypothetical protein
MKIYDPHPLDLAQEDEERDADPGLATDLTFAVGTTLECGTPPAEFRRLVVRLLRRLFGRRRTSEPPSEG